MSNPVVREVRGLVADRLVFWAFRLNPERFKTVCSKCGNVPDLASVWCLGQPGTNHGKVKTELWFER